LKRSNERSEIMLRATAETWAGVSKKVQISPIHSIVEIVRDES